jgi:hypothetical protein
LRKKLVVLGLTITAVAAITAVALAQTPAAPVVTVTQSGGATSPLTLITPAKGGSKKKPKNAATHIEFTVNPDSYSTLKSIAYTLPSKVKIDVVGQKYCTADQINQQGEASCPSGSKVGTGAATAILGKNPGTPLNFTANVYASGKKALALFLKGPLAIQVAFPAKISGHTISFDIPTQVQNPTGGPAGPYSYVTSVTADLGPKQGKTTGHGKHKQKHYLISRTGCSGGKDSVTATLGLADNPGPPPQPTVSGTGSTACSK